MFMEQAPSIFPTTLAAPMSISQTSMSLASAVGMPVGDFAVLIEGEVIFVGNRAGTNCTNLVRGENDTARTVHPAGAVVTVVALLSNRRRIYFGPLGY